MIRRPLVSDTAGACRRCRTRRGGVEAVSDTVTTASDIGPGQCTQRVRVPSSATVSDTDRDAVRRRARRSRRASRPVSDTNEPAQSAESPDTTSTRATPRSEGAEHLVHDVEAGVRVVDRDRARRHHVDAVGGHERPHAALLAAGDEALHRRPCRPGLACRGRRRAPSPRTRRDPRTSPMTSCLAAISRRRGPSTVVAERAGVLDDALLLEDVDRGDGGGAGQRMAGVRETTLVHAVAERVGDGPADHDAARAARTRS